MPPRKLEGHALSPMQAGMLYQVLRHDPEGSTRGYDLEQVHVVLGEALELSSFERAWRLVAQRYPVLLSSFDWTESDVPRQYPQTGIAIPLETLDLRASDAPDQRRLQLFLQRDRARGFNLRVAPLQRVTVLLTARGATEFVWTLHHILLDGRSFATVLSEVFIVYDCLRKGRAVELPPVPRRFADYIDWLAGVSDPEPARAHFSELLRGKAAATPLPRSEYTAQRSPQTGYATRSSRLDPELEQRIGALAERTETTIGTVLQAAWAIVLARFTGDEDVLFGVLRNGRSALDGEARSMLGIFTYTLPLRVRLAQSRTVRELLTAIRSQSVALRPVEHTPLVEIQRQSEIALGSPLFESLLLFDNRELASSVRAGGGFGTRVKSITLHEQPAFPLTVKVHQGDAFLVDVTFDRARLDEAVIERLIAALIFCLDELTQDADREVAELGAVPPSERDKLLHRWNDTARDFPDELLIHESFERRARAEPDAIAFESRGESFSYAELERRANRLAHELTVRGVGPASYVGICLRRSVDLVVAMLAVCKSGAAYLPLDPSYPAERLLFMLGDSAAPLVITESQFAALFTGTTLVLDAEDTARTLAARPSDAPAKRTKSSEHCYVIYTSGSTGTPKGAVLTHRAVVNTLDWVNRSFEVGPGDRALFVTSPSFDLSVYDVFGILGAGATVVIAEESELADPEALARTLIERQITIWNSAPSFLQLVLPFVAEPAQTTAPALRLVLLSGDWIPLNLVRSARKLFPSAKLVSLGGATEAAIWSNWFPIETIEPHWVSIPYGRPIQNARYYALDQLQRPVPIGATGELYIGGECVAQGYLNRPELTAERFVRDPFSDDPHARLYRTGDLVRRYEDGELEILGRVDRQLKIRGFRVEIAEVEAAIAALPEIRDVVCSTQLDASGQRALVAYVVPRDGQAVSETKVKEGLARTLPEFMVPAHVTVLANLPLSPNGKIDHSALPNPKAQRDESAMIPLTTPTEHEVARIWQRVLERSPIGAGDNFFSLGGHSLLAIQAFNEIERQFGIGIHIGALFEYPTLGALAARIDQLKLGTADPTAEWTTLVPIQAGGALPPLFCAAGSGGNPIGQRNLVPVLGSDQPLYALQHRGVDGRAEPHTDIRAMAREFLTDIQRLQPHGPYYIAGFSGGGVAAYELACLLRAAGEQVPLLVLLDAFNPASWRKTASERFVRMFQLTHRFGLGFTLRRVFSRVEHALNRSRQKVDRFRRPPAGLELRDIELQAKFRAALDQYTPPPYDGDVLLVRCNTQPPPGADDETHETNGWRPLISGQLEVVSLDCSHDDLLGDHATATAGLIRAALDAVRRRARRATQAQRGAEGRSAIGTNFGASKCETKNASR